MNRKRTSVITPVSEIIDAAMDGYVTWREESAAVRVAYESWRRASPIEEAVAFEDYFIALDREERAASEYRRLIELAQAA